MLYMYGGVCMLYVYGGVCVYATRVWMRVCYICMEVCVYATRVCVCLHATCVWVWVYATHVWVGMYATCVWVPSETRGIGSPGAGIPTQIFPLLFPYCSGLAPSGPLPSAPNSDPLEEQYRLLNVEASLQPLRIS